MISDKKRKMYLITKEYPLGNAETSFIEPEYQKLINVFDITTIVSELKNSNNESLNDYLVINSKPLFLPKIFYLIKFLLQRDAWSEFFQIISGSNSFRVKNLYRACMYGAFAEAFFNILKKKINLKKDTEAIFYFYWWDYKCLGLTMNRKKYPHIKIVARTHGYDLYDERERYGRQYFKPQMDRELDRLIFVSYYGKQYYLRKYHIEDGKKYPVHYLGVRDPKVDLNRGIESKFHIVSCSNVIPIKRIELIIAGLSRVNKEINIKWVHMGDGCELTRMQLLAQQKLGENIAYEFMGYLPNNEVIRYYREHNVNCFITTTATEGNPVSVQEALSFGIPIIATSVSDIPRMIDGNGILLDQNPKEDEIAEAIEKIATMGYYEYIEFRKKSYKIYAKDYDCEKNHQCLVEDLMNVR